MRLPVLLALGFILVFFLLACSRPDPMPEIMPDDFNFSVRFGIESKNEINTFDGTVTKDLIVNGTILAKITLSRDEMQDIYERMRNIDVLESDLHTNGSCNRIPYEEDHWRIHMNGRTTSLDWSEKNCTISSDAKELKQLREYIFNIVKNKPEYQSLPEAVGGYD